MGIADGPCSGYVPGEGEPHYRSPLRTRLACPLSRLEKYRSETRQSNTGAQWDRAVIRDHQRHTSRHQKTERPGPSSSYYIESPAAQIWLVRVPRLDGRLAWPTWNGARTITVGNAVTMLGSAQRVMAKGSFPITYTPTVPA